MPCLPNSFRASSLICSPIYSCVVGTFQHCGSVRLLTAPPARRLLPFFPTVGPASPRSPRRLLPVFPTVGPASPLSPRHRPCCCAPSPPSVRFVFAPAFSSRCQKPMPGINVPRVCSHSMRSQQPHIPPAPMCTPLLFSPTPQYLRCVFLARQRGIHHSFTVRGNNLRDLGRFRGRWDVVTACVHGAHHVHHVAHPLIHVLVQRHDG